MNVQNLYKAVMILGRSLTDIKGFGWICDTIGDHVGGPKCANGILTVSAGIYRHGRPLYIYSEEVPLEESARKMLAQRLSSGTTPITVYGVTSSRRSKELR